MVKRNKLLLFILTIGVFGILNTEMGIVGILPLLADHFHISVSKAGLLVSLFALAVAISGPTMPLLFSDINRKKAMLLVLGVFVLAPGCLTMNRRHSQCVMRYLSDIAILILHRRI